MSLQSKKVVYAAIGGLFAMMGGFVLYAGQDNPQLEMVEVELAGIDVISTDRIDGSARIKVTFMVSNPSEKTFTVPVISYHLFANGVRIGSGQYSTEDIAMPGRAAFYPGAQIPLDTMTTVSKADVGAELYDRLIAGEFLGFSAEGQITTESAWSIVEKPFNSSM